MTTPLIVGTPSASHREALLRETAGGGRVPRIGRYTASEVGWVSRWGATSLLQDPIPEEVRRLAADGRIGYEHALILSHPTDPEAGAMGLARLEVVIGEKPHTWRTVAGWVVRLGSRVFCAKKAYADEPDTIIPALATATCAAEAIGLVCVHLGIFDSVEEVQERT